jgi:hypothetical protein
MRKVNLIFFALITGKVMSVFKLGLKQKHKIETEHHVFNTAWTNEFL